LWGFVGFVKKAESCQKESTNRIHETDILNTVVRNKSTKWIFEHHRWIRKTNPDSWRTNLDFLQNESKLTGYESGFAKRIHVFTNLLYESRILTFNKIFSAYQLFIILAYLLIIEPFSAKLSMNNFILKPVF
jgi:hypothetical protein